MIRLLGGVVAAVMLAVPALLAGAATGAVSSLPPVGWSAAALADVPQAMRARYEQGARSCEGMPAVFLAAIIKVESDHGRNSGVSSAGAVGPAQFLPSTWASWGVDGDGDGRADPRDPDDAVAAAARFLCTLGAGRPGGLALAAWRYNHGPAAEPSRALEDDAYVRAVLGWAAHYAAMPATTGACDVGAGASGTARLQPVTAAGRAALRAAFCLPPSMVAGWRPSGSVPGSDHPRGLALDVLTGANRPLGARIAMWAVANAGWLHVRYVIFDHQIWTATRGWHPYRHPADACGCDPTLSHEDHVHVSFRPVA